jgi:hypothetical protein
LRGLSRVLGNSHARFLVWWGGGNAPASTRLRRKAASRRATWNLIGFTSSPLRFHPLRPPGSSDGGWLASKCRGGSSEWVVGFVGSTFQPRQTALGRDFSSQTRGIAARPRRDTWFSPGRGSSSQSAQTRAGSGSVRQAAMGGQDSSARTARKASKYSGILTASGGQDVVPGGGSTHFSWSRC